MPSPPLPRLTKLDPASPVLEATGRDALHIKAGTIFPGKALAAADAPFVVIGSGSSGSALVPGSDYFVVVAGGLVTIELATRAPDDPAILGGFHYAPGGNAPARAGGDDIPAINPCSLWDINFRPACPDPRGMAFIATAPRPFWCDIYLTGVDHLDNGTSAFGVVIADDRDPPRNSGGRFKALDHATAIDVMTAHGKALLAHEEFIAAAYGVTERTSAERDPKTTGLDAPRTSRFGLMQATGNLWIWGHDGDPDLPRASLLGGSWINGASVGSRFAVLGFWTDFSSGGLGARGRGDHLRLD